MIIRQEFGQISWFIREHLSLSALSKMAKVRRGISLPPLSQRKTVPGSVWAVTMVKDEQDIIAATVNHLFSQGVDHIIVADNLSTDDTPAILARMAESNQRLHLAVDKEPAYYQAEKMSRLMHATWAAGADWVIPFDADEFWFAEHGTLKSYFTELSAASEYVGIVDARFYNMIPVTASPADYKSEFFVLDSTPAKPGKVAVRAHRLATVSIGNHGASRVGARRGGLHIAHAIYRGPQQVARKVRQGMASVNLAFGEDEGVATHWRAAATLSDADIDNVWANISAGSPEPLLKLSAWGPMVRVQPPSWTVWDPQGVIPRDLTPQPVGSRFK